MSEAQLLSYAPADPRATGRGRLLALLAFVAFVSLGLPDAVLGVAWPSVRREFDVPVSRLGALIAAGACGYLVSSFFSGQVVAAIGIGRLLRLSSVVVAVALAGTALSVHWGMLVACALAGGLGAGAIDAGINAFAADQFSPRAVTWLHACYGVGATLGPLLMTFCFTVGLGWRNGYLVLAAALGVMTVLFFCTIGLWDALPVARRAADAGDEAAAEPVRIAHVLRRPIVWAQVALFFLYAGIEVTAGQWLFTLLTESRHFSTAVAGTVVGGYWAALTIGRIVFGQLATRVSRLAILRCGTLLAPLAAAMIAWSPLPGADVPGAAMLGFALAPIFPMLISATPDRVGRRHAAHAIGFQVSAATVGVAALPGLAGVLARQVGLEVIGVVLLVETIALLALHEAATRMAFAGPPATGSDHSPVATDPAVS